MQLVIKKTTGFVLSNFESMGSAIFVTIRFYSGLFIPIPFYFPYVGVITILILFQFFKKLYFLFQFSLTNSF